MMNNLARAAVAAVLASVMAIPMPAAAAPFGPLIYQGPVRMLEARCINCGPRWSHRHGHRIVRRLHSPFFWAPGILGFGAGLFIGRTLTNSGLVSIHVQRCSTRFRSFDLERDAFLGFDGRWHRCRL